MYFDDLSADSMKFQPKYRISLKKKYYKPTKLTY